MDVCKVNKAYCSIPINLSLCKLARIILVLPFSRFAATFLFIMHILTMPLNALVFPFPVLIHRRQNILNIQTS